jgi:hypothetical protein
MQDNFCLQNVFVFPVIVLVQPPNNLPFLFFQNVEKKMSILFDHFLRERPLIFRLQPSNSSRTLPLGSCLVTG